MAITSSDIQNQSFKIERRGYDVDEVDVFLERVASEIDDLNDEIARLRVQVKEAASASRTEVISERPAAASDEEAKPAGIDPALVAEKDAMIAELEAKLRDRKSDDTAIAQALIDAGQTRQNAEDEGRRILEKANVEKQKVIDHINELSSSREKVREQYQDMLKEFIGSATQRLAEIGGEVTAGIDIPAELLEMTTFDATSSADTQQKAEAEKPAAATWEPSPAVATYTTPTVTPGASAPATPKPSTASKDFSGYGDADDTFSFDDMD